MPYAKTVESNDLFNNTSTHNFIPSELAAMVNCFNPIQLLLAVEKQMQRGIPTPHPIRLSEVESVHEMYQKNEYMFVGLKAKLEHMINQNTFLKQELKRTRLEEAAAAAEQQARLEAERNKELIGSDYDRRRETALAAKK